MEPFLAAGKAAVKGGNDAQALRQCAYAAKGTLKMDDRSWRVADAGARLRQHNGMARAKQMFLLSAVSVGQPFLKHFLEC